MLLFMSFSDMDGIALTASSSSFSCETGSACTGCALLPADSEPATAAPGLGGLFGNFEALLGFTIELAECDGGGGALNSGAFGFPTLAYILPEL